MWKPYSFLNSRWENKLPLVKKRSPYIDEI